MQGATSGNTLCVGWLHEAKFDPLLGLDFCGVLGDALRDERGLARRLPRVTRRPARHRVGLELVNEL